MKSFRPVKILIFLIATFWVAVLFGFAANNTYAHEPSNEGVFPNSQVLSCSNERGHTLEREQINSGGWGPIPKFKFKCNHIVTAPPPSIRDPLGNRFGSLGEIISDLLFPYVFGLAGMLALLFLIWGGIRFMLARGDPKAIDAARNTITSALIGLVVILLAVTITYLVGVFFKIDIFSSGLIPNTTVYAQGSVDIGCTVKLAGGECIRDAFPNAGSLFTNVVRLALFAAGGVFLAMIVWGGFGYLNSGGNPDSTDAARQNITNAVIGLLIVVASFAIIEIIIKALNTPGINSIF